MPSLTINYTAQEGQRVATALGRLQGLRDANGPRAATEAEVKKSLIGTMRGWVDQSEREIAQQSISVAAFDPT
jgi:hypothetical protein